MHLCAELIAASMTLEPLGEVGANFFYNFHREHSLIKSIIKKVIAENQCEKHKKIDFSDDLSSTEMASQRVDC